MNLFLQFVTFFPVIATMSTILAEASSTEPKTRKDDLGYNTILANTVNDNDNDNNVDIIKQLQAQEIEDGDFWQSLVEAEQEQPGNIRSLRVSKSTLGNMWLAKLSELREKNKNKYYNKASKSSQKQPKSPKGSTTAPSTLPPPPVTATAKRPPYTKKTPNTAKGASKLFKGTNWNSPNSEPSGNPLSWESVPPSQRPSESPSKRPTVIPSLSPSQMPSMTASAAPSTTFPSVSPSNIPSEMPSTVPTMEPSTFPSASPSIQPSSSTRTTTTDDTPITVDVSLIVCQCDSNDKCLDPPLPPLESSHDLRLCFFAATVDNNKSINSSLVPISVQRLQLEQPGFTDAIVQDSKVVNMDAFWSCNKLDSCVVSTPVMLEFFNRIEDVQNSTIVARGTIEIQNTSLNTTSKAMQTPSPPGGQLRGGVVTVAAPSYMESIVMDEVDFTTLIELKVPDMKVVVSDQLTGDESDKKRRRSPDASKLTRVIGGTALGIFLSGAIAYYYRKGA